MKEEEKEQPPRTWERKKRDRGNEVTRIGKVRESRIHQNLSCSKMLVPSFLYAN